MSDLGVMKDFRGYSEKHIMDIYAKKTIASDVK